MIELNKKNILIAAGIAVAATAAVVGVVMLTTRKKWCPKHADTAYESMIHAFDAAMKDHPNDRERARFTFELAAAEIRKTFVELNSQHEKELNEWLARFDEQVKKLMKDIRKA